MNAKDELFFFLYGFTIWSLATISYKAIGFDEDIMYLNFLSLLLIMPALNLIGYRVRKIKGLAKYKASILFVFSGLILDAFIILNYDQWIAQNNFNLMPNSGIYLGAWLLFGNSITALTAFVSQKLEKQPTSHK
ncbi:MAG: DUF5367 family protein [Bacteroidota bacterium]